MTNLAYYNENDPYAAQWLRNLIDDGQIPYGDVDERDIRLVRGTDLRLYGHCHFFAGIGGWALGLGLAGWPAGREVWTGSCPCQPFSAAGARKGFTDERHLWPEWLRLIHERRPATILGEQVGGAIGQGWLDAVFADLENENYACGAAVLPAAGVGAPHIRQRLWFVAESEREWVRGAGCGTPETAPRRMQGANGQRERLRADAGAGDAPMGRTGADRGGPHAQSTGPSNAGKLGDAIRPRLQEQRRLGSLPSGESGTDAREAFERAGASVGGMGYASGSRQHEQSGERGVEDSARLERLSQSDDNGRNDFWHPCDWLPCTDGKARPVEPGSFPLAHGVQRRASKLRAYGNAIVPQAAAAFVVAAMDAIE